MDFHNIEPYQLTLQTIIQQIDQLNWQDLLQSNDSSVPDNAFFKVEPPQLYAKYYLIFHALLNKEQISQRAHLLTTLMLKLKTTNYYALMLRSKYFFSQQHDIEDIIQEIFFANCLLKDNSKEYQLWTYKKKLFNDYKEIIVDREDVYQSEINFIDYLLGEDLKNYHIWDYKLWLTVFYSKEQAQLNSSEYKLFKKNEQEEQLKDQLKQLNLNVETTDWKNCYSLWSFRYNLRLINKDKLSVEQASQEELRQVDFMREWMGNSNNLMNECGWNYLTGLILELRSDPKELLLEFSEMSLRILQQNSRNRFAGNAFIQFAEALKERYGEKVSKREVIQSLIASDKVRMLYYQYLLEG